MKRVLLIGQLLAESPTSQIQRDFWGAMIERHGIEIITVCEPGPVLMKQSCRYEVVRKKEWIEIGFRILRGLGLRDLSHLPDTNVYSWAPFAYRRAKQICKEENIDYIYSISWPCSNHLVARRLKQKFGLPWVASFYDPWIEHIVKQYKFDYFKRKDVEQERKVAECADLIFHTNSKIVHNWKQRYENMCYAKIHELPLCYNFKELTIKESQFVKSKKLRIAHIGGVYGNRSSSTLLEALNHLFQFHPDFVNRLEITFVGGTHERELIMSDEGISHLFKFVDKVPFNQVGAYFNNADIFLLLDMNMRACPFFPSKLILYQYYRKPILGITQIGSVLEQELQEANYPVFYYGESKSIEHFLFKALSSYQSLFTFNHDVWKKYDVTSVADTYYKYTLEI